MPEGADAGDDDDDDENDDDCSTSLPELVTQWKVGKKLNSSFKILRYFAYS